MRHGSTRALVASSWWLLLVGSAFGGGEDGSGSAGPWILPAASQGVRVAPILLLSRPDVQADLQMKPDQVADVHQVILDLYRKAAALHGRKGQDAIEQRRAVDEAERLWLETKLTEDQVGRLSEIDLRWEGAGAIATRPAVGEALSLSDSQRTTLARALVQRNAQRVRPAEGERDPAALERSFQQQVWATLSEPQRKRWERMIGRPFAVAATTPADRILR